MILPVLHSEHEFYDGDYSFEEYGGEHDCGYEEEEYYEDE